MDDTAHRERWRGVVRSAKSRYAEHAADLVSQPTFGARVMVRLAAATLSVHDAIVEAGFEEPEARRRTARVTWFLYGKAATPMWTITRVRASDLLRRF